MGIVACGFVGVIVAVALVAGGEQQDSPNRPIADSPTACPTAPGAEAPPGCPTSRQPTAEPTPTRTYRTGEETLKRNPLYTTEVLGRGNCRAASGVQTGDLDSAKRYLEKVASCLERIWRPNLKRTPYEITTLKVIITAESVQSPCGVTPQDGGGGLFCHPGEGTAYLYVDPRTLSEAAGAERVRGRLSLFYAGVLAHEYGHYVQYLVEISRNRTAALESAADPKEPTRRSELQADCFAGAFIGSVSGLPAGRQRELLLLMWESSGSGPTPDEPTTHGTGQHRLQWLQRGLRSRSPGRCNTWTASHGEVR